MGGPSWLRFVAAQQAVGRSRVKIPKAIIPAMAILLLAGCADMPRPVRYLWPWEPNPAWTVEDIPVERVPKQVVDALRERYPGSTIDEIEQSTFGSRLEGYPKQYRFRFSSRSGTTNAVTFDEKGNEVSSGSWFSTADMNTEGQAIMDSGSPPNGSSSVAE